MTRRVLSMAVVLFLALTSAAFPQARPPGPPRALAKALDAAMTTYFAEDFEQWRHLAYDTRKREVGWQVRAKLNGGVDFVLRHSAVAQARFLGADDRELAVIDSFVSKLRFDPGADFPAGRPVKVYLPLPVKLDLAAVEKVVLE